MPETLRVDTGLVSQAGADLQAIAAAIPPPPPVSSPTGADALSTAIAAKITEVVDPVIAQMPVVKQALDDYAKKVEAAAAKYDTVDRALAEGVQKLIEAFDAKFGKSSDGAGTPAPAAPNVSGQASAPATAGGSGMPAGSGGGPTAGHAPSSATTPISNSTADTSGAAQQSGQFGQMMQMPMQMAQQAAQAPTQMMGMAGSIPQAVTQGLQSVMQSVGQSAEGSGGEPGGASEQQGTNAEASDGAAPGVEGGERAPEFGPQQRVSLDTASRQGDEDRGTKL